MRLTEIKLERLRRGLRQLELAQLTGISRCRLSEIECGWIAPRADELERIARALDVPLACLSPVGCGGAADGGRQQSRVA
jgi:transcriptional regulator with XRE-family HTH domain